MKNTLLIFFALSFLCSCDTGNENKPPEENKSSFGWRKTGLEPDEGSSFALDIDIFHFGEYIFVKNLTYIDTQNRNKDIYSKFIFYSKQGTMAWDILKVPEKTIPSTIYADTGGLYVGMREIGQLWHYNPYTKIWTDLKVPELKEGLNVHGITRLDGKLVLSLSDLKVWYYSYNAFAPILIQNEDGTWEDITPSKELSQLEPLVFGKASSTREWQGNFFAIPYRNGFWKFNPKSKEWARISSPVGCNSPFMLEVFESKLYVGFGDYCGVFILNEDLNSWTKVDSIRKNLYIRKTIDSKWELVEQNEHPNPEIYYDYQWCKELNVPDQVEAFATNGKDLFLAGIKGLVLGLPMSRNGMPLLYTGNRGEPKGWRRIHYKGGWQIGGGPNKDFPNTFPPNSLGAETVGLDIVGDTLYAANRKGIYKFPLSDLDSGIVNEYPYPYYCIDQYLDNLPEGYMLAY